MPPRRDFARHLQRQDPLPVYALVSTEPILLSEAIATLRTRVPLLPATVTASATMSVAR